MTPSWFGTLVPWLIVAGLWISFSLLFALAFSVIARAEAWRGRK